MGCLRAGLGASDADTAHDLAHAAPGIDLATPDYSVLVDLSPPPPPRDMTIVCDKMQPPDSVTPPSGNHNPGKDCLECHDGDFTVAGTLYSKATGGSAVAGATITVVDANGQSVPIITAENGNFWTEVEVAFPITARASLCPTIQPMPDSRTVGGCNSCHDSTMRIHVP